MVLLIFLLVILLVVGLGWAIFRQVNTSREGEMILDADMDSQYEEALRKRQMPYGPVAFGKDFQWMAVKATYRERVAAALGLSNIEMVNWQYGLHKAKENYVFITPNISGWILATGWGLGEVRKKPELLEKLSRDFGEVQYFHTHQGSQSHSWMRYMNGELIRKLVCEEGDILTNEGTPATVEGKFDADKLPTENLVFDIANEWSLSPTLLDTVDYSNIEGLGTLGYLQP